MMKERHFRLWKKFACVSIVGPVAHVTSTKNTCVLPSRMLSTLLVPTTGKCCGRLQAPAPLTYTERVKFRSRLWQSNITCSNAARLLFTTSSSDAVSQSPTNPGRDATAANKRNVGLKNNTANKQVSSTRRPSTQKVHFFFYWTRCNLHNYGYVIRTSHCPQTDNALFTRNAYFDQTACKIRYHNLCIRFGT